MANATTETHAEQYETKRAEKEYFVLVCRSDRQEQYQQALATTPLPVEIVRDLDGLLASCVSCPPRAVLLDIGLVRKVGSRAVAPVLDLRMNWPVLRCVPLPDGEFSALCLEPRTHGPLLPMLQGIADHNPVWKRELRPARERRRHLRVEIQCRVCWRIIGDKTWHRGTTLDLGAGGAFVVTFEELNKGAELEIEIWDIQPNPTPMRAVVVGDRRWENSNHLPGVGIEFDEKTVPDSFIKTLAESITLDNLV